MHQFQTPVKAISPTELKALLYDLANHQTQTSIKLEIEGKAIPDRFSKVLVFEKHALLLTHLATRSVLNVPSLDDVTGFMIDEPHQLYLPFHRYFVERESVRREVGK